MRAILGALLLLTAACDRADRTPTAHCIGDPVISCKPTVGDCESWRWLMAESGVKLLSESNSPPSSPEYRNEVVNYLVTDVPACYPVYR
jgi:hypothetical protein